MREKQKKGSEICMKKSEINEISKKKKREDPQYTREIVKEKSKSIQEDLSSLLFNLDLEIFQSFQEIFNQQTTSSQAFVQAFIHLEKIRKGFFI